MIRGKRWKLIDVKWQRFVIQWRNRTVAVVVQVFGIFFWSFLVWWQVLLNRRLDENRLLLDYDWLLNVDRLLNIDCLMLDDIRIPVVVVSKMNINDRP